LLFKSSVGTSFIVCV
jgi:hypothetical protein